MNPIDNQVLFHGRQRVWQSFDGASFWFDASPSFVNNVSAIGVSPANPDIIMAGSNTGELMISLGGGFDWEFLDRIELSNNFITDIEFSYIDEAKAWVTYSGFGNLQSLAYR